MITATWLHAEALAAIHHAAFPPNERWDAKAFTDLLATPGAVALLDERGGLALARRAGGEADLLTIAVAPEARRQGIGRALLTAVLAICDGPVFLEVAADNAPAAALYRECGFAPCGRRRGYYGPGRDAVILKRTPASGHHAAEPNVG